MRGRLLALVTLATIPIAAVAVNNAWESYRLALQQAEHDIVILREVAVARHGASIASLREMLTRIARTVPLPEMEPRACDRTLDALRALKPERYSDFWLMDADGTLLCSGRPSQRGVGHGHTDDVGLARTARSLVGGEFTIGAVTGRPVLAGAVPILGENGALRALVGGGVFLDVPLRGEPPRREEAPHNVWLLDKDGTTLPLGTAQAQALPPDPLLHEMLGALDVTSIGTARNGSPQAWSIARLDPGLHLLVGFPLQEVRQAARKAFDRRILELAIFLMACVLAILIGVELGVSRPLRRLAARVQGWTPGRPLVFDAASNGPREVRAVEQALAAAAGALQDREAALTGALRQRDLLMAEIHHRVKNNLQVVASLLNLQADRLRSPAVRAEFGMARDRVQALATLHRHLYLHQSFERISLRPFLEELSRQLGDAMGAGPEDDVSIVIDAEDMEMASDQAISLALLLTEAVSNALRYAFPDGRRGTVTVALHLDGEEAQLRVSDDGIGIGAGMVTDSEGDGLGLDLIRGFASHLGGVAEISGDGGTTISVRFPLQRRSVEQRIPGLA